MTSENSPACAGKAYEYHERTEPLDMHMGRWRCPACGDTGTTGAFFEMLLGLRPQLYHLQEQTLNQGAIILVPSSATPRHLGQVFGRPVFRMNAITEPMIALPASRLWHLAGPKVTIGPPVVTDETGNVIEPLAAELVPFLDYPLYFPDDTVHCDKKPGDCANRFCVNGEFGPVYIASARRLTVREFLADVKAHAEEKNGG